MHVSAVCQFFLRSGKKAYNCYDDLSTAKKTGKMRSEKLQAWPALPDNNVTWCISSGTIMAND